MGLGIVLVVSLFGSHWVITIEDEELDVVMKYRHEIDNKIDNWLPSAKGTIRGNESKEIPKFVFVDVDNQTHKQWKVPAFIPRDKLKNLIHFAAIAGAKLIIVDVQLTIQLNDSTNQVLRKFLEKYQKKEIKCIFSSSESNKKAGNNTQQQDQECPPIILLRTFQEFTLSDNGTIKEPLKSRPTLLDDIVKPRESYHLVQWASAEFVTNEDRVRRWWLWQPISYEPSITTTVIPSFELLTAAMVCNDTMKDGYDWLYKQFASPQFSEKSGIQVCRNNSVLTASGGMYGIQQRIMYSMPWNVSEKETDTAKFSEDRIIIYPAKNIPTVEGSTEEEALKQLSPKPFKDAIVLIGGSYDVGHDNHLTPLGEMPGGLVIINAINSFLKYGEINELKPEIKFFSIIVFIFFVSVAFTFLESFVAKMFLGIVILLVLVPVSIIYLNKALWVDFALLLIVLEIFHLITEMRKETGKDGKHEPKDMRIFLRIVILLGLVSVSIICLCEGLWMCVLLLGLVIFHLITRGHGKHEPEDMRGKPKGATNRGV